MNLQQLQDLTFSDSHLYAVLYRLVDFSSIPEGEQSLIAADGEASLYDRITLHSSLTKPSLAEMEAEFFVYKAELVAAEEARLAELARVAAIKVRLAPMLVDPIVPIARLGLHIAQPNWAIIYRDIIVNNDIALLEQLEAEMVAYVAEQAAQLVVDVMDQLRAARDVALTACDFTQLADAPLTSEEKVQYRTYRNYLRSLPAIYEGGHQIEPIVLTFAQFTANPVSYPAGI